MPQYEYRCAKCGHHWTAVESLAEHGARVPPCPRCAAREVEPVLAPFFAKTVRKS
ncbi:MAG: FmdB family zinc ribbon protein [Gemmatimonadales bacterium]